MAQKITDMMQNIFSVIRNRSVKQKVLLTAIAVLSVIIGVQIFAGSGQITTEYITEKATKGSLISSISGSGSISSGNYNNVNTKVSGVVEKVYVANGEKVTKGQKIADIILDDYAKERQTDAWVAYLEATEAVKEAINNRAVTDIQMWKDRQAVLDAQKAVDDMEENDTNPATHAVYTDGERAIIYKTLDQSRLAFNVTESKYVNSNADIANAQAKVNAAMRNYQENTATITAPADGVLSDLMLAAGLLVNASSTTSNTSGATIVSSQTIAKIANPNASLMANVSLSEIDIVNVKAGQKVSLTIDAFPDLTFTGKVLAVNTSGGVSSGVTSYPVTILLDPVTADIYPNMGINVDIITEIKNDVIMIPTTAITMTDGRATVEIKKGNQYTTVPVQTGSSNDTYTEIISGIAEGDEVVTSVISSGGAQRSDNTISPFSGLGRSSPGGSSGNAVRGTMIIQGGPPGGGF